MKRKGWEWALTRTPTSRRTQRIARDWTGKKRRGKEGGGWDRAGRDGDRIGEDRIGRERCFRAGRSGLDNSGDEEREKLTMQHEQLTVRIRGLVPQLQKNGQTADPMNEHAKAIKAVTAKKKKTDEDYLEIARLEFLSALYLDEKGHPCWPGECLEGMIRSAAKKERRGNDVLTGIFVDGNFPIIYEGPKDPAKLFADPRFRDMRNCGVNGRTVVRCRPIFRKWELEFVINYDPSVIDRRDLERWLDIGGKFIGLSDFRPKFGRFIVVDLR